MKKILTYLLAILVLAGCSKEKPPVRRPIPKVADQTILLYMTGTQLGGAFQQNLRGTMTALDGDILGKSRFLVFYEPAKGEGRMMELYYSPRAKKCVAKTIKTWAEEGFNSMDSKNVTEIIDYMDEYAPAGRYGMIIGGHAFGWVPETVAARAARMGIANYEDFWAPEPGMLPTRWIGDPKSGGNPARQTEIPLLAAAIEASQVHFDYLVFDACLMSSIEALYDLRTVADRIVASPTEIMAQGFPYAEFVPSLLTDKGASYDLDAVCHTYYDYYLNRSTSPYGTIALTVTGELEALAEIVRRIEAGRNPDYNVQELQRYISTAFNFYDFYDLRDYIEAICTEDALLAEFNRQLERAFPSQDRLHTPTFYSRGQQTIREGSYSGVSTSAPTTLYEDAWQATAWYGATH